METSIKHRGTVKSFDRRKNRGLIEADSGGEYLIFERSGIYQNPQVPPVEGQRLTFELGTVDGQRCAVNLGNV
jgi:cold shock CspA family protein